MPPHPRRSRFRDSAQNRNSPHTDTEQTTEKIRKDLFEDVKNYNGEATVKELIDLNKNSLEECILDPKDRHQTLLHWIVVQVEGLDTTKDDSKKFLQAAKRIVAMAMKHSEKLISEVDQEGGTALHHAIKSRDRRISDLINVMCGYGGSKEYLRKAIAWPNSSGENCLHIAIERRLDVVDILISIADETAFTRRRSLPKETDYDHSASHDGNTPLHDAVKYERGVFSEPKCQNLTGGENCDSCDESYKMFQSQMLDTTALVTKLIEKCSEALKIKNNHDESPYLYHLRTKRDYKPKQESEGPATCAVELNHVASNINESHLIESAFIVGGFKDACACFFGDKTDKDGKSSPLRPGYPITEGSHTTYQPFIFKDIGVLSHVDLQIGRSAPSKADKMASSKAKEPGIGANPQKEVRSSNREIKLKPNTQWKKDMNALTKIFKMLEEQGVKRILKVTIRDNQKEPCSDRIIQQCLSPFDVRYLDWSKPDLNIGTIYASCPRIAELTLYSSGRKAVLDSWVANTGLCRLRQLSRVNLNAVAGLEEYNTYTQLMRSFQVELIENIQLIRTKLILKSKKEECKWDIDDLHLWINELSDSKDNAEILADRQMDLKKEETKQKTYSEELLRIEEKEENLESQRLENLLGNVSDSRSTTANAILHEGTKDTNIADSEGASASIVERELLLSESTLTNIPRPMNQKWSYVDKFDGNNNGTKLIRVTSDFNDYSPKSLVSSTFQVDTLLEQPPSAIIKDPLLNINQDGTTGQVTTAFEPHRWVEAVQRFVENSVHTDEKNKHEIKVALIDDGINIRLFDGLYHSPGWPPVEPDSDDKLWYHSEKGHGTIMAQMIHLMCPRVRLFVARLGSHDDLKTNKYADKAADAIAWAIENKVDIISMSWSLISSENNQKEISRLEGKIKEAAEAKILLYCAAADLGPYVENEKLFPHRSSTPHIRVVGSAKEAGGESHFVDSAQIHYLFPGERIPGLEGHAGSSVATALAAGFAALILWCVKQAEKDDKDTAITEGMANDDKAIATPEGMHKVFQSLMQDKSKWVNVTSLLGINEPRDVKEVVKHCKSAVYFQRGTTTM